MIFGIGIDVLQAQRMHQSYARFGTHLLDRLLLPQERRQFEITRRPERFLAMRFAAKEAIVKAMGTGFAHGIWIRDIGVVHNAWGKPEVIYSARGERVRRSFDDPFGGKLRGLDPSQKLARLPAPRRSSDDRAA